MLFARDWAKRVGTLSSLVSVISAAHVTVFRGAGIANMGDKCECLLNSVRTAVASFKPLSKNYPCD